MPTGSPVDPTQLYADIDDVLRLTRGEDTNLSDSDISSFITQKTRLIEKETGTAFRELELSDVVLDVEPTSSQKRDQLRRRRSLSHSVGLTSSTGSSDRFIDVHLPNDRIRSIDKIQIITDASESYQDITSETDKWRLINERDGVLQIDHRAFTRTLSGKKSANRYKGAKVKLSYSYGREDTRPDIREACAKLSAYELLSSDAFGNIRADDSGFVTPTEYTDRIYEEANEIIQKYK